ncbi:MAG: hypothetical protein A4E35_00386 [Methanoregula sp. PtaU1.Bin051]|nr:MAG: hypothetical protein A4E35_00386 [Methanoregula sp. PtaU1.Bin051]
MAATFFCPFCGKQEPGDLPGCPFCGKSIRFWREHPYEERLLLTLRHPIIEHRMDAIRILGGKRYRRAVPVFARMIRTERDVYLLREIAIALNRIDTPQSRLLIAELLNHPSPVVKSGLLQPGDGGRQGDASCP